MAISIFVLRKSWSKACREKCLFPSKKRRIFASQTNYNKELGGFYFYDFLYSSSYC